MSIGLILIAIKRPRDLPKELFSDSRLTMKLMGFLIIFWLLVMVYVYKIYFKLIPF